ncbi:hypothetical protein AB685_14850 [Bacillus sp. LL01]|uniref:hypothetical protein n=1 Tax=Bacillus sp. LL01 TaxID=1665556 RepID=UPI00064D6AE3|nr:hypothetical protein [Bacillus sp. LL01]KMJ58083.1 hypothetical protein AB685_14850 [Bacillus sp. LL01]
MLQTEPLRLDIQFFAEGAEQNTSDETKKTEESAAGQHMIPKSRFDEVNTRYKDVQAQLAELQSAKEVAERKAKEEQGEFRGLYETTSKELDGFKSQLEQANARAQELESVVTGLLDSKLSAVPKELHDLIPENLSPEQKLAWLNRAEEKGLFKSKVQEPIGESTNAASYSGMSKESFAKLSYQDRARLLNENPELYKRLSR